ncbi:12250_t:CDS:2 [Funneliformis mosseae]|uniref:12250_t:CDS:1 n=1 Tax=Funneliformis mosseae TaxID=27381 RepID=A0A9N9BPH3_FUNMO|nr:12250_t:CDS:2 [Funneliformis mosseae]
MEVNTLPEFMVASSPMSQIRNSSTQDQAREKSQTMDMDLMLAKIDAMLAEIWK